MMSLSKKILIIVVVLFILFELFTAQFAEMIGMRKREGASSYAGLLSLPFDRFNAVIEGTSGWLHRAIPGSELEKKRKFLEKKFDLNFKITSKGPFIIAHRCSASQVRQMKVYTSAFYQQIYPRYFKGKLNGAITIVYFESKPVYVRKGGVSAYGHYSFADKALYTYAGSGYGTLWHELVHAFLHANNDTRLPQWFSEGFASFYEMGALRDGKIIEGYSNWRMPSLKKAIQKGTFIPLNRFLRMRTMEYHVGYAEARFLFCYLWMHRKMVPFVKSFLYEICPRFSGAEQGKQAVKLIEELLGKDITSINREFRALALRVKKNRKLYRK